MQCSLYGKLPTKRDFIAIGTPREFLSVWEPWLQSGVSASRATLAEKWQDAFLTAPIWRFWLGGDICGKSAMGAFMPSLDGVGRYFPLTLFAVADASAAIAPPEFNAQEEWFRAAEAFLMSTLDHGRSFEDISEDFTALPLPVQASSNTRPDNMIAASDGTIAVSAGTQDFSQIFGSLRTQDHARIYAGTTCWWTIGGEGFEPMALSGKHMPDPFLFASLLTGQFPNAGREVSA